MRIAYHEKLGSVNDDWISLSKPRRVFNVCYEKIRDELLEITAFSDDDFKRVHHHTWVDDVISCNAHNGFGDHRPEVIEQVRYTHGALYAAAKAALENGISFAPVSGFHHAGYSFNGGFCTFNGLMTTIAKLRIDGFDKCVLILDFDGHWGDGTDDILHRGDVTSFEPVIHMGRFKPFKTAEESVKQTLEAIRMNTPGLVLYQAGADSLLTDSFGAGYFTKLQWDTRDRVIFEECKKLNIPIVWNLAGGYNGKDTIMAHYHTFQRAVQIYDGV
jgi:acetoin utilization deacetylase AcuC-like enzyme